MEKKPNASVRTIQLLIAFINVILFLERLI